MLTKRNLHISGKYLRGFLGAIVVLALMLLASGISKLSFAPFDPFAVNFGSRQGFSTAEFGDMSWVIYGLLVVVGLMLMAAIIGLSVSSELRERTLKYIRRIVVLLVVYAVIYFVAAALFSEQQEAIEQESGPPASEISPVPESLKISGEFTPEDEYIDMPGWLWPLVAVAITALSFIVSIWVWSQTRSKPYTLEKIAQTAVDQLAAGVDWEDVIIQCYIQMNDSIKQDRGLLRKASMTPEEFSKRLIETGLPKQPVQRLTKLFEKARYGRRAYGKSEAEEARHCLAEIVSSIQAETL